MITKDKYRSRLKVDDLVAQILELKQIPLDDAYNILYDQDKIINIDEINEIININEAASLFVNYLKQGRDICLCRLRCRRHDKWHYNETLFSTI